MESGVQSGACMWQCSMDEQRWAYLALACLDKNL